MWYHLRSYRSVGMTREETELDRCRWQRPWFARLENNKTVVLLQWSLDEKKKKNTISNCRRCDSSGTFYLYTHDRRWTTEGFDQCVAFWRRPTRRIWLTEEVYQSHAFFTSQRNGRRLRDGAEQRILHFPSNLSGFLHCNACQSTRKSEEKRCEKEILLIWYEKNEVMSISGCAETTSRCASQRNERRFYDLIRIGEEKTNCEQVTLQAFIGDIGDRVMNWIDRPLF